MDSTRQAPVDILATTTTEENESTNKPMKRTFEHVDDEDELLNHLSKQQQRKLRKLRRAQKRGEAGLNTPEFVLKLEVEKNGISIKDVRNLILWCIGEGVNPRWMLIKNKLYLYRVVVLLIPFLDASIFDGSNMNAIPMEQVVQEANTRPERNVNLPKGMFAYLPRISTHFKHVCPTRGPSENYRLVNPFTALIQCPLTKSELKLQEKALREQSENKSISPEQLLLSVEELCINEFILPPSISKVELPKGWIATQPRSKMTSENKVEMYAIDCEMVKSEMGTQLARVTLIDQEGNIVMDELVKQEYPVTDYLTKYSGMTKERLDTAKFDFEQVRQQVLSFIHEDTILIGHSINNDLYSLKLAHGRVIDTSIIYPHSRGPPFRYSLRQLASKYLGRTIQQHAFDDQDQPIGHDSIEDAITCLDLVKLKLKHGLNFGKPLRETVSLFHRLSHQDQPRKSLVVDYPTEQWLAEDATTFIPCTSDDQIIDQMIAQLGSYHLVIGRLHALEQLYTAKKEQDKVDSIAPLVPDPGVLEQLDQQVDRLIRALPSGTALMVLSGHGDTREALALSARREKYYKTHQLVQTSQIEPSTSSVSLYTEKDNERLRAAIATARLGISMYLTR